MDLGAVLMDIKVGERWRDGKPAQYEKDGKLEKSKEERKSRDRKVFCNICVIGFKYLAYRIVALKHILAFSVWFEIW